MSDNKINWDNLSNASIKMNLESLMHEQISLREKIIKLSEKLESIEKEYFYGNKVLIKRYKGEE
jgi:hypothetical protein